MNFELVPGQEVNQTYPDTSLEMFLNFLLLKKLKITHLASNTHNDITILHVYVYKLQDSSEMYGLGLAGEEGEGT